jgi:tetratricopeptide (TPR) repeat protein
MYYSSKLTARFIRYFLPGFFLSTVALLCFIAAQAQSGGGIDQTGTGGRHTIQGRIYFPSGRRTDARARVRLESYTNGALSVLSDPNGSFRFTGLNPGSYTVIVDMGEDYEIATEAVYIESDGNSSTRGIPLPTVSRLYTVQISLQLKAVDPGKTGVVNAALAAAPSAARELYRKALDSAKVNDNKKAVEQLRAAVAIYPNFPLALNELGVQYLILKQPERAAQALDAALKLSPDDFLPRLNYGIALAEGKSFHEAELQLRQAVKKNDSSPVAHLYLGITLISLHDYLEAEKELLRSVTLGGQSMSLAHYYLGGLYWQKKQNKAAADQLELYLKLAPNSPDSARTRATISELRKQQN